MSTHGKAHPKNGPLSPTTSTDIGDFILPSSRVKVYDLEERIRAARTGESPEDAKLLLKLLASDWPHNRVDRRVMGYLVAAINTYLSGDVPTFEQALGLMRKRAGNPNKEASQRHRDLCDMIRFDIEEPRHDGNPSGWWPREKEPTKSDAAISDAVLLKLQNQSPPDQNVPSEKTVARAVREVRQQIAADGAEWQRGLYEGTPEEVNAEVPRLAKGGRGMKRRKVRTPPK